MLPIAAAPTRNASAAGPSPQNCCSVVVFGRGPRFGAGRGPVVVLVQHRHLPGRGQRVVGDDLTGGFGDQQPAAVLHQPHRGTDQPGRHRVPGGREPDAGQPVDLPGDRRRPDLQPQGRQRAQHLSFLEQPGVWDRGDLRVHRGVDLGPPQGGGGVRLVHVHRTAGDLGLGQQRHHQISLRVPDEVFHDPLRFRVVGVAEVRRETVMRREPHVVRCRDHHIRDDPALQARHPVREDLQRDPTGCGEGFGDQRQRGGRPFSSVANATNLHRDHASTAQNRCNPPPTVAQSITRYSPGVHTAGRRPR